MNIHPMPDHIEELCKLVRPSGENDLSHEVGSHPRMRLEVQE